tara:strand:- start:818 stop:1051 length:234 start_codon:yes stop_codon:yes gene_type:complete
MVKKKGWLAKAEARPTGYYVKGEKLKSAGLTQAECDAWNGVKAPAPKPAPVVEAVVEASAPIAEPAAKKFFKKKKKK